VFIQNLGISIGEIMRIESPIMMRGETNEKKARRAMIIPAIAIGKPRR